MKKISILFFIILGLSLGLASCGNSGEDDGASVQKYSVKVNVNGFVGTGLVLQNNSGDDLAINTDGEAIFATKMKKGSSYSISVKTAPSNPLEKCTVTNGAGTISDSDITISVFCDLNWSKTTYIKASNTGEQDQFGMRLAFAGDTLVVSASYEDQDLQNIVNIDGENGGDIDLADKIGAVYVFKRDDTGNWVQDAYLKGFNSTAGDEFGDKIATNGQTIVVGTRYEDGDKQGVYMREQGLDANVGHAGREDSGAVYIFQKDIDGFWYQEAYLKASDATQDDFFGASVAIEGDFVFVGVSDRHFNYGAVYVFKKNNNGDWEEMQILTGSNATHNGDYFGRTIATNENTLIVGDLEEVSGQHSAGRVYIFKKDNNGQWVEETHLEASNSEAGDRFGSGIN